jgi:chemotaxis protein methyltransferase CheR
MITDEEMELLLYDILEVYGYDFNDYAKASFKRRLNRLVTLDRFPSFAEFRFRVKNDKEYFNRFIEQITVNVTEMFRDPDFYQTLRKEVLPVLSTYPFIRIWHAGCSTGEEVFSMAIILKEANLLHKSILYATDINAKVVTQASTGVFNMMHMKQYTENYNLSGGSNDFSKYYTAGNNKVIFDQSFKNHMVFSTHNLVAESSFNEFQLIVCRNVLIYFEKDLQAKVFNLFDESLERLGFLALGNKESIRLSPANAKFKQIGTEKIWRKMI